MFYFLFPAFELLVSACFNFVLLAVAAVARGSHAVSTLLSEDGVSDSFVKTSLVGSNYAKFSRKYSSVFVCVATILKWSCVKISSSHSRWAQTVLG